MLSRIYLAKDISILNKLQMTSLKKGNSSTFACMQSVLNYIESLPKSQCEMLLFLYDYFDAFPTVEAKYRYKIPFYFQKSWICYTAPKKNGDVELVFLRGSELSPYPFLESRGRKMVKGILYKSRDEILLETIEPVLMEALQLDLTVSYKLKKLKK